MDYKMLIIGLVIGALIAGALVSLTSPKVIDNSVQLLQMGKDINEYKYNGKIMYNHLVVCFATAQCLNDMAQCQDLNKLNEIGKLCLNADQNTLKLYDIFTKDIIIK